MNAKSKFLCGLLAATLSWPAVAAESRSCSGYLRIYKANTPNDFRNVVSINARFSAITANAARRAARNQLNKCLSDHWEARWQLLGSTSYWDLPTSCHTQEGVGNYSGAEVDIKRRIAEVACSTWGNNTTYNVVVQRKTSGDHYCNTSATLASEYEINPNLCSNGW